MEGIDTELDSLVQDPQLTEQDLQDLATVDELLPESQPYTVLETEIKVNDRQNRDYERWRHAS